MAIYISSNSTQVLPYALTMGCLQFSTILSSEPMLVYCELALQAETSVKLKKNNEFEDAVCRMAT